MINELRKKKGNQDTCNILETFFGVCNAKHSNICACPLNKLYAALQAIIYTTNIFVLID